SITMRNVYFRYPEKGVPKNNRETELERTALNGLTLTVPAGQIAALVGPSGAGKSTVAKLLLGFYPADTGTITIAGQPIDALPLKTLRELIAFVPQEAHLFDGTIEWNIQLGRPDATAEEIVAAAKAAGAHDFIVAQPDGYQTSIGERGARLSGGQRQRIAIARAVLKNAPFLLLDEATSALDSESEAIVQEALSRLMAERTTLAIAHRLSTIEGADIIHVIDQGRVVEQGTHVSLLTQNGLYTQLHTLQFA
ncbi:MAG: ABC transporter ATP-binding protein, partial [Anaerolineae bacterium]